MSATGSSFSSRTFSTEMLAPILFSTSSTPERVGLMPTPESLISALGCIAPATSQNAAPLMSPGTEMSTGCSSERATVTLSPFTSIFAPIADIMRSVWSRDIAGCLTVVSPSAWMPAMSRLDFTWADATGWAKSMPVSPPPLTARGARESPPRPRMSAPICLRGWITRSIGRESRDSSPVSTLKNGCAASSPVTSLAAVPLLPASSTFDGSTSPSRPRPGPRSTRRLAGAVPVLDDLDAEASHAAEYGRAVVSLAEVRHARRAIRDRVEKDGALGYGLVARKPDFALQPARGSD